MIPSANTRTAVWGVTGFIGRALARTLNARGSSVLGIGRSPVESLPEGVSEYRLDSDPALPARLAECGALINLTGLAKGSSESLVEANVTYQERMAALLPTSLTRVVHVSTINVFFSGTDFYGSTKEKGEAIWSRTRAGQELCIVRLGYVYDLTDCPGFAKARRLVSKLPFVPVPKKGSMRFLHRQDAADVLASLVTNESPPPSRVVVTGGQELSYSDFIRSLAQADHSHCRPIAIPSALLSIPASLLSLAGLRKHSRKIGALQVRREWHEPLETWLPDGGPLRPLSEVLQSGPTLPSK